MALGSVPKDDGALILEPHEYRTLINEAPQARRFIKRYVGSAEFINDRERYCLWIEEKDHSAAAAVPEIAHRLERFREFRAASTSSNTSALADVPYRFWHLAYKKTDAIILPIVSSARREYIPLGYMGDDSIVSSLAYVKSKQQAPQKEAACAGAALQCHLLGIHHRVRGGVGRAAVAEASRRHSTIDFITPAIAENVHHQACAFSCLRSAAGGAGYVPANSRSS
ncbi:type IIL restriction-modification enzyme MmeI [Arthrobacter sp.]|uniref:type IIL restriction-modification enzyme MmeI n=1 Tax=Arthrobacter sp. TaxID=1667 RepID=UPI003391F862